MFYLKKLNNCTLENHEMFLIIKSNLIKNVPFYQIDSNYNLSVNFSLNLQKNTIKINENFS